MRWIQNCTLSSHHSKLMGTVDVVYLFFLLVLSHLKPQTTSLIRGEIFTVLPAFSCLLVYVSGIENKCLFSETRENMKHL
jgi:hypothetical protein